MVDLPPQHVRSSGVTSSGYDISPDGERFLIMIDTGEDPSPTEIHITLNWFEELEASHRGELSSGGLNQVVAPPQPVP